MREIKFRGKDCWGNWRYGDLMKNFIPTASPVINEDYPAFDLVPGLNVDSNGLAYCEHYTGYDVTMYVIGNIHNNPELQEAHA